MRRICLGEAKWVISIIWNCNFLRAGRESEREHTKVLFKLEAVKEPYETAKYGERFTH